MGSMSHTIGIRWKTSRALDEEGEDVANADSSLDLGLVQQRAGSIGHLLHVLKLRQLQEAVADMISMHDNWCESCPGHTGRCTSSAAAVRPQWRLAC